MEKCTPTRRHKVFVHDLNQFVTVQPLEGTPAVASIGKLCKDHGYPYGWVSGQEPRLTKEGKSIICKTDTFVPLVVPGLSVNSGSSSSPTSIPQESLRTEADQASGIRAASSSSSGAVFERSDEQATRRLEQETLKIQHKKRGMTRRMRTIRWQIFRAGWRISKTIWWTQNCLHPHTVLANQTWTSCRSGVKIEGAAVFFSRFPKDRNCDVCLSTKITKASFRRRTGEALASCRTVWWLDNGGSQGLQWGMWMQRQSPVRCRGARSHTSTPQSFWDKWQLKEPFDE